ncbi:MAG: transposase [Candidatus Obscuribacter phosphatis]|uniref:Transposase n=1 Tax=Candidatus Obscuribacter phosphatis TaxID=1906157 RepID=A0A8J7PIK9_9BACT|nr:transposase [Candidatus Obscuribacter phosphatis]
MVNGLHQRHTARWTQISDIEHHLQNAFLESFNGRYRDERLNQYWFTNNEDAASLISKWKHDYNKFRPHSALGNRTPLQFSLAAEEANPLLKENKLDLIGNIKLAAVS